MEIALNIFTARPILWEGDTRREVALFEGGIHETWSDFHATGM